jgi:hypothetical protein
MVALVDEGVAHPLARELDFLEGPLAVHNVRKVENALIQLLVKLVARLDVARLGLRGLGLDGLIGALEEILDRTP